MAYVRHSICTLSSKCTCTFRGNRNGNCSDKSAVQKWTKKDELLWWQYQCFLKLLFVITQIMFKLGIDFFPGNHIQTQETRTEQSRAITRFLNKFFMIVKPVNI